MPFSIMQSLADFAQVQVKLSSIVVHLKNQY